MTAYRINDQVTVTHDTHGNTWTGQVVNAFPAGDRLIYAVRPDGAGPEHPGFPVEDEQMALVEPEMLPGGAS